ncbi:condensin complex subunit 1-like [Sinocyclocheilus rhinocerous]|uniref:condensin complex subunit 1-like n=1 Tax=Sinocyclocheilus rhinocerous TaxID=307959 RepID=UPI0007B96E9B|nr:PREDICTED: condensin complex subunit 1-like [Sinocyclocheilus rhinocerous]
MWRARRENSRWETHKVKTCKRRSHTSVRKTTRGRGKPKLNDSDLVTPRKSCSRPKHAITFTSDEEEEEDAVMAESETPKVTTPIARTRRTRLRH